MSVKDFIYNCKDFIKRKNIYPKNSYFLTIISVLIFVTLILEQKLFNSFSRGVGSNRSNTDFCLVIVLLPQ